MSYSVKSEILTVYLNLRQSDPFGFDGYIDYFAKIQNDSPTLRYSDSRVTLRRFSYYSDLSYDIKVNSFKTFND